MIRELAAAVVVVADTFVPSPRSLAMHAYLRARADGHSHVGLCQRRRVVDPVPDHRHHVPLRLF
jgi:hypothetical protein